MRLSRWRSQLAVALTLLSGLASCRAFAVADPYQEELLAQLIMATPGSVIELRDGTFNFDSALSLTVDNVTIKGKGMNKSILNFKNQVTGAEGLIVTANGVHLEGFSIQDTRGDALKINRSKGVVIRNVKTQWTRGPHSSNGGYGIYPVQSENILIEHCEASDASDTGIYVGQSKNVIIRRNHTYHNVAGIEVENSIDVDVYDNLSEKNAGGILVFDLPNLSQRGQRIRVFENRVKANNLVNFGQVQNTVSDVPSGTGIMVMASKQVEIFNNDISDSRTAGLLLVSYLITKRPLTDSNYDPYPESLFIYGNRMTHGGYDPQGGASENTQRIISNLRTKISLPFPAILFDGYFNPTHRNIDSIPAAARLCIREADVIDFINLDAMNRYEQMDRSLKRHACEHPKLPAVSLPGVH